MKSLYEIVEKGRAMPIGTVRKRKDGRRYKKTAQGWKPVKEGKKKPAKRKKPAKKKPAAKKKSFTRTELATMMMEQENHEKIAAEFSVAIKHARMRGDSTRNFTNSFNAHRMAAAAYRFKRIGVPGGPMSSDRTASKEDRSLGVELRKFAKYLDRIGRRKGIGYAKNPEALGEYAHGLMTPKKQRDLDDQLVPPRANELKEAKKDTYGMKRRRYRWDDDFGVPSIAGPRYPGQTDESYFGNTHSFDEVVDLIQKKRFDQGKPPIEHITPALLLRMLGGATE